MTPMQKTLVQQSFKQVVPIADTAATIFYERLFVTAPAVRPLFKSDLAEQKKKLVQMLAYCVGKLDAPDELLPAVRALGRRHVGYGVTDEHYDLVGATLLWTLEKGLGAAFTPEVKEAWTTIYQVLAATMIDGASANAVHLAAPAEGRFRG
jgi:hemoglobin-like flavoprotein